MVRNEGFELGEGDTIIINYREQKRHQSRPPGFAVFMTNLARKTDRRSSQCSWTPFTNKESSEPRDAEPVPTCG
jgi:hypothetical protein